MVTYEYREDGGALFLTLRGHASEYESRPGQNIVCAGVSTVCDMLACGCEMADKYTMLEGDKGFFELSCTATHGTRLLMQAALKELGRIQQAYPDCLKEVNAHDAEDHHAL